MSELPASAAEARRRREKAGERSGMPMPLASWSGRRGAGLFWAKHEPAFHAYDYGADIEIEVSEELYDLPWERYCPVDEDEDDGDVGEAEDECEETLHLQELSITHGGPGLAAAGMTNEALADDSSGYVDNTLYSWILRECNGLYKTVLELGACFQLDGIAAISYALAVCINSDRTTRGNGEVEC
ncbi:hypothetical protein COL940_014373 [Colletotrichum noveboracense]|nr:hypothetical protein COL940_014373 [Colletotrichum noveboracense]